MDTTQSNNSNSSYSTQAIINMIQSIDKQRENLNAHILSNNHPDIHVMRARHKNHKQRSHELEIKFKQLESITAKYVALHGTHELEQAYAQYKMDEQRAQDQIDIEILHKIVTLTHKPFTPPTQQTKIVHNVSFSDQSNISAPTQQLKRKRTYNKINSHYIVPYDVRKKPIPNKQFSAYNISTSSIQK